MFMDGQPSMSEVKRCLRQQDYPCAEADILAYTKKYPKDGDATALLATTLTEDGRHEDALRFYAKAEAMGVSNPQFEAGYAKSLEARGDLDGAIKKNQAVLKQYPYAAPLRGQVADELVRAGRGKEALGVLQDFDRLLADRGFPPMYAAKIRQIQIGLGGAYAKQAAADEAQEAEDRKPVVAAPGQTVIKGERAGNHLMVPVSINGSAPERYFVDSGASDVSISYGDAMPLMRAGKIKPGDLRGTGTAMVATGASVMIQAYNVRSFRVGDYEAKNVRVDVRMSGGPRLLGQNFLKRFKRVEVDNKRAVLVLTN
jgi:predicted aspartyl protease